jgi:hypothetical protein
MRNLMSLVFEVVVALKSVFSVALDIVDSFKHWVDCML